MSVTTIVFHKNCNIPSHAIFKETWIPGKSWLHDKTKHELIGFTEKNKVYRTNEYWDEDSEELIEDNILLKECDSEEKAIEYAKEVFGVTRVN